MALLPGVGDLDPECDCPDWGNPCVHAGALCYQAAWLLDADPFVLLLLRGRGREEIVTALTTGPGRTPGPGRPTTTVSPHSSNGPPDAPAPCSPGRDAPAQAPGAGRSAPTIA